MALYEITNDMGKLFDMFDEINEYEPEKDEDGNYIDENGNIISDVAAYKEDMLTAWYDTMTMLDTDFELKAENIAVVVKNKRSEIEALKNEEAALKARRKHKERESDGLVNYLMSSMKAVGKTEIDKPKAFIKIKLNPESCIVDNPTEFVEWAEKNQQTELLKYEVKIRLADVKKRLKVKEKIPFVHLERLQNLQIK